MMGGWLFFAILAAIFAAATSILAKIGIQGVNSNLATAIRTIVVLIFAWGIVFITGAHKGISEITPKGYLFLILSGVATGFSWLCYFRAIQIGEVSKVAPIDKLSVVITMVLAFLILGEQMTGKTIIGGILITAGVLVLAL
jgi:transporter family protein